LLLLPAGIPAYAGRGRWASTGPEDSVYLVVPDPVRPGVVYASVGSPESLFRSTDGGDSWIPIVSPWPYSIAADSSDPDVVYVGGFSISRSEDAGATWQSVAPGLTANYVGPIVIAPEDPDVLYVETHTLNSGTYSSGTYGFARVERRSDGTYDWSVPDPDFTTQVTGLVADASSSGTIFASGMGGVYRSSDGGDSWSTLSTGLPADTSAAGIAISPGAPSWIYAPVGITTTPVGGVVVSRDGGETWALETNGLSAGPLRCAAVDPRDRETAYVGSVDAGVFRSVDGGRSWQPFSAGLSSLTVYSLAVDAGGRVYAGTGDGVFAIDPVSVDPAAVAKPAIVRRR